LLYSAIVTLQSSQLIITGTNSADAIRISASGSQVVAAVNGMRRAFAAKDVKSIVVNAKSGNDLLRNDTTLPSTLTGGSGNDTLKGGPNDDALFGGGGNDLLRPGDGNNTGAVDLASDALDYRDA